MPQVEKDKRCFPLNKETVKNTFVCEQVCVNVGTRVCLCLCACVCVCVHAPAEADTQAVPLKRQ